MMCFYSYKGLSPLHWVSIQRGHPEKTNLQGPMMLQAACTIAQNTLSLNQLQTKTQQNPRPTTCILMHLSCFVFCMHVHKCYLSRKIKDIHLRSTEGHPISNFKDSVTMTWNAWHAFMTPAGFCLDLSDSLWEEKSAGEPQEGIYMLNTASSGRSHWTEFTQGGAVLKSNEFS